MGETGCCLLLGLLWVLALGGDSGLGGLGGVPISKSGAS